MDALHKRLTDVLDGMRFKNQEGELRPVTIYRQRWPEIQYFSGAAADARIALPACCIFLPGFKTKMKMNNDEPPEWEQRPAFLIFNTFEEIDDGRATLDLITMAEAVKLSFLREPLLPPSFYVDRDIEFDVENLNEAPVHSSPMTLLAWSRMQEASIAVTERMWPGPPSAPTLERWPGGVEL